MFDRQSRRAFDVFHAKKRREEMGIQRQDAKAQPEEMEVRRLEMGWDANGSVSRHLPSAISHLLPLRLCALAPWR